MIKVEHVKKEFISPKKYPGLRGALKGLVSREKVRKVAVDDISFHIKICGCIFRKKLFGKRGSVIWLERVTEQQSGNCL